MFRSLSSKPFGVNIAISRFQDNWKPFLECAIEQAVPVISITGGDPSLALNRIAGLPIKSMVLVANVKQALKAQSLGASAIIAVGHEGGGHIGQNDTSTLVLVPTIVDHVTIPVIASGGIGDGRGLAAAIALGAQGVEMGTRFIATQECFLAHDTVKRDLVLAQATDTIIIKKTLNNPGRVLKTPYSEKILQLEHNNVGYEGLSYYINKEANLRYLYHGDKDNGFGWAGQVIGLIHDIPTVATLMHRMIQEAETIFMTQNHVKRD